MSAAGGSGGVSDEKRAQFERGESIEVPLGKIESELTNLWRVAALPKPGETPKAVTRACLWNLILRVEGDQAFIAAKRLVDDLSAHVPARVMVLHVEADRADQPIKAWVEANWRRSGHVESGSDEVTLYAPGAAANRLPPLVRSLIVPDAPVAMLWFGHPPEELAPVREMLHDINRLIVDSRQIDHESHLADYEAIADMHPTVEIVDLAWLGVRPLRGLCAGLFDGEPLRLSEIDRVRVISGVQGCQSRALLTLGWLASRLGWGEPRKESAQPNRRRWRAKKKGGEVIMELETRTSGAPHGVVGLELYAGSDQWSLSREQQKIDVHGPGMPDRCQPVRTHADADLVVSALGPRGRDPVYREALHQAVLLVRAA